MADWQVIENADDVTDAILRDAESTLEWFDGEARIDWEAFIDRMSDDFGPYAAEPYEILEYDNAAVRKIQRHVRALRAMT